MGKKNLDKLFQEKFKNFSEVPDEKVWQQITASLDKKKKSKKIVPLWWKLSGAAAVLGFFIFILNPFESTSDKENPAIITNVEKPVEKEDSQDRQHILGNTDSTENEVVDVAKDSQKNDFDTPEDNSLLERKVDKNTVVTSKAGKEKLKTTLQDLGNQEVEILQNNGPTLASQEKEGFVKKGESKNITIINQKGNLVAVNNEEEENASRTLTIEKDTTTRSTSENIDPSTANLNRQAIAQIEEENSKIEEELKKKKSIFDAIEASEEEKIVENKDGKWAIGANVAPVYFNSFGDGSPIHSSFAPNSKSGNINMSYGLSVSYQISKKLSLRSGVNKVDYGYDTNDIEFSSSLASSTNGEITNINYIQTSENLVVESVKKSSNGLVQKDAFVEIARDGVMAQQFGYLEIPMELNYALIDNRFGIDLVGGVSSLFLIDNSVALSSGELTTEVGEANNLNTVNFSTNVGFGLNYKVTPKIRLNVEPVFKYQLNTFSNTAGDFQPFSLGIYSGLNFKF